MECVEGMRFVIDPRRIQDDRSQRGLKNRSTFRSFRGFRTPGAFLIILALEDQAGKGIFQSIEKRADMVVFVVRVSLTGSEPEVWRRLRLPEETTLYVVHLLLQLVMNWENRHRHQFVGADRKSYGVAEEADGLKTGLLDERLYLLSDLVKNPGDRFTYIYDFEDEWVHEVVLETPMEIGPDERTVWCLDGSGACPPEECGGVSGYHVLLDQLRNRDAEGNADAVVKLSMIVDPETFDSAEFNEMIIDEFPDDDETELPKELEHQLQLLTEIQDFLDLGIVPESAMPILTLEGYFAALAIHPVTIPANRWMPLVWDTSDSHLQPAFSSAVQKEKVTNLLVSYRNLMESYLSDANNEYDPLYSGFPVQSDEDLTQYAVAWVSGFLLGAMLDDDVWTRSFNDETGHQLLEPFLILSGLFDSLPYADSHDWSENKTRLAHQIGFCVEELRDYWKLWRYEYKVMPGSGHTVKVQPRVGRNEKCPCGSGKKYKQCCGK